MEFDFESARRTGEAIGQAFVGAIIGGDDGIGTSLASGGADLAEVKRLLEEDLLPVLQALKSRLVPPEEIPKNLAQDLMAIVGHIVDDMKWPEGGIDPHKLEDAAQGLAAYLRPAVDLLLEKLALPAPAAVNVSQGDLDRLLPISPSPAKALDLLAPPELPAHLAWAGLMKPRPGQATGDSPDAKARLAWTGAMPGIEFGFYDVGDGGVRDVRLSPLPLPTLLPPPTMTLIGNFFFGILGALAGASYEYGPLLTYKLLYSLFPGYPSFFDVPVEDGAAITFLPIAADAQALSDEAPLPLWPGSGHLPVVPGDVEYLPVVSNLASIFKEDFGSLKPPPLDLRGLPAESVFNTVLQAIGDPTQRWNASALAGFPPRGLALPALRVVRPTAQAFPARLMDPAPLVLADPRRARSFLLIPARVVLRQGAPQQVDWYATPLYHPDAGRFVRIVNRGGLTSLYEGAAAGGPLHAGGRKNGFDDSFVVPQEQSSAVLRDDCVEGIHFTGPTGPYNWELFFHLPLYLASRLSANLQFADANAWLRRVFDPTVTQGAVPQRYWRFKALHDEAGAGPLDSIETLLRNADAAGAIERWKSDPADADAVAKTRPGAYQRATVLKTVDMLVAWGNHLFEGAGRESVDEAALLYTAASGILGQPAPAVAAARPAPRTYNDLRRDGATMNAFGGALVAVENLLPGSAAPTGGTGTALGAVSGRSMLYFGIPANERWLLARQAIADGLFKIRHGLDITGRPLAALASASGWPDDASAAFPAPGPDDADGVADAAPPIYRFSFALQKAYEICAELKALGSALLSAYEKRDAEKLARLRSDQEQRVLEANEAQRRRQIDEAEEALKAASASRDGAVIRMAYYKELGSRLMNEAEAIKEALSLTSSMLQIGSGFAELAAGLIHTLPDFAVDVGADLGAAKATGMTKFSYRYGASHVAAAVSAHGRALGLSASVAGLLGSLAGTQASYQRRRDEWVHQRKLAENDARLFETQIEAAKIRLEIARAELVNHRRQIEHAREVGRFLREKFSNEALYQWMVEETTRYYLQTYRIALRLAQEAFRSYRYERPDDARARMVKPSWDSAHEGLLAGEGLQLQLRQLEDAWLTGGARDAELVRHISLHRHDSTALIQLRQTGRCHFDLPERLFDEDHPGQYMRRIKSVSMSIPCVVGPYTAVNCRLTLEHSRIRIKTGLAEPPAVGDHGYAERPGGAGRPNDERFVVRSTGGSCSIATSSAQNDAGLFEVNLRDERYLPFEGAGAISHWRVDLPLETNRFDLSTITDVVLHLKYTAKDAKDSEGADGEAHRRAAAIATFGHALGGPAAAGGWQGNPQLQCLSARAEFATGWSRLQAAGSGPRFLDFDLGPVMFPAPPAGCRVELLAIEAVLIGPAGTGEGWAARWSWCDGGPDYEEVGSPGTFAVAMDQSTPPSPRLGGLISARLELPPAWRAAHDALRKWRIGFESSSAGASLGALDVLLLCEYRGVSA